MKLSMTLRSRLATGICALSIAALAPDAGAQYYQTEFAKVLANDGASGDALGWSVAVHGNRAIVGAYGDDSYMGAAYIYTFNGSSWVQQQRLQASDRANGDRFGYSVSIHGDWAVIGAYFNDDLGADSGSAYIFKFNGSSWSQQTKLLAFDGASTDYFGYAVDMSSDTIIVSAYADDDVQWNSGSVYVYKLNGSTWSYSQKLIAPDPGSTDNFGISLAIDGSWMILGSPNDNDNGGDSGSAYLFYRTSSNANFNFHTKLLASDGAGLDYFGTGVDISGNVAVVGSYKDDDRGTDSGAAYVYRLNGSTWSQQAKLVPTDGEAYDYFGYTVDASRESSRSRAAASTAALVSTRTVVPRSS
jgi:hypothetical protein